MAVPAFQDPVTGTYYFYDEASGYYYDPANGYCYHPNKNVFYASTEATDGVPQPPVPVNSAAVAVPGPAPGYSPPEVYVPSPIYVPLPIYIPSPAATITH
jgi:hypothetical protein